MIGELELSKRITQKVRFRSWSEMEGLDVGLFILKVNKWNPLQRVQYGVWVKSR